MVDIVALPPLDPLTEQLKVIRTVEREIGALQYKLKLVDELQRKGYDAIVIADIWKIEP